ncbi:hypothetical protein C0J50_18132 [Silurus asotus]|uniref:Uncharacterized protein n=1 Tax=Silurus asotus TaxID=30991 RepID=A0AAD5AU20_SILAS|nr:hypothetical protein C0J50_18132 [Silurus asotus]
MLYLRLYDNTRLQAVCVADEIRVEESIEAQRSDAITAAFSLVIHCNQDATTPTLYICFLILDRTIFHPVLLAALLQLQFEAHQESSSADYVESNCMSRGVTSRLTLTSDPSLGSQTGIGEERISLCCNVM